MSTLLTHKTTVMPPWAGLRSNLAGGGLLNRMGKLLEAFSTHRAIRRAEAEVLALDTRTLKDKRTQR